MRLLQPRYHRMYCIMVKLSVTAAHTARHQRANDNPCLSDLADRCAAIDGGQTQLLCSIFHKLELAKVLADVLSQTLGIC